MNWASATMPASLSSLIASLFCSTVVCLRKRSSFNWAAASVPSETCTSPALRYRGSRSRSRRMSVTRVLMPHFTPSSRSISSSHSAMNLRAVDGRLFVRQDEEADLVLLHQHLDLVDELLGVARAVRAPELPLRAEAAGERAAAREVRHRHAAVERDVDVLVPLEQRPVGRQRIQVLDHRARRGRHQLAVLEEGDALDLAAARRGGCRPRSPAAG